MDFSVAFLFEVAVATENFLKLKFFLEIKVIMCIIIENL